MLRMGIDLFLVDLWRMALDASCSGLMSANYVDSASKSTAPIKTANDGCFIGEDHPNDVGASA